MQNLLLQPWIDLRGQLCILELHHSSGPVVLISYFAYICLGHRYLVPLYIWYSAWLNPFVPVSTLAPVVRPAKGVKTSGYFIIALSMEVRLGIAANIQIRIISARNVNTSGFSWGLYGIGDLHKIRIILFIRSLKKYWFWIRNRDLYTTPFRFSFFFICAGHFLSYTMVVHCLNI